MISSSATRLFVITESDGAQPSLALSRRPARAPSDTEPQRDCRTPRRPGARTRRARRRPSVQVHDSRTDRAGVDAAAGPLDPGRHRPAAIAATTTQGRGQRRSVSEDRVFALADKTFPSLEALHAWFNAQIAGTKDHGERSELRLADRVATARHVERTKAAANEPPAAPPPAP